MNPALDVKTLLDVNKMFSGVNMTAWDTDTIFTDFAYQTKFMT